MHFTFIANDDEVICYYHFTSVLLTGHKVIIQSCWSICSRRFESNNTNLLLRRRLLIAVLAHLFCFIQATKHTFPTTCAVYLATMDTEFSDVTAPYLLRHAARRWKPQQQAYVNAILLH